LNANRAFMSSIKGSYLYQIPLPELETKTYGAVFKHLAGKGMLSIGILRGVFPITKTGAKGNIMEYVYTNPQKVDSFSRYPLSFLHLIEIYTYILMSKRTLNFFRVTKSSCCHRHLQNNLWEKEM
jgi:hypothetical protein